MTVKFEYIYLIAFFRTRTWTIDINVSDCFHMFKIELVRSTCAELTLVISNTYTFTSIVPHGKSKVILVKFYLCKYKKAEKKGV